TSSLLPGAVGKEAVRSASSRRKTLCRSAVSSGPQRLSVRTHRVAWLVSMAVLSEQLEGDVGCLQGRQRAQDGMFGLDKLYPRIGVELHCRRVRLGNACCHTPTRQILDNSARCHGAAGVHEDMHAHT